jgi:hypothetical protein
MLSWDSTLLTQFKFVTTQGRKATELGSVLVKTKLSGVTPLCIRWLLYSFSQVHCVGSWSHSALSLCTKVESIACLLDGK